jgi:hypothetical protein
VVACFVAELVTAFFFLLVTLGSTHKLVLTGFAPIPIGLAPTLIHLITIPVTNTSLKSARSIGPALLAGGPYIAQSWPKSNRKTERDCDFAPTASPTSSSVSSINLSTFEPLRRATTNSPEIFSQRFNGSRLSSFSTKDSP